MKTKNIKLEELRKEYTKKDSEFIIRIREKENDIVYYNGIKAFEIQKKNKDILKIAIADNIFNLNKTNIENACQEQGLNIEKLKEAIKTVRKDLSSYFHKILGKITLEISTKRYSEYVKKDNKSWMEFIGCIQKMKAIIEEKYQEYIDVEQLNAEKIEREFDYQVKKIGKKTLKYEIIVNCKKEEDNYIGDIVDIEYEFIKNFIFDEKMQYRPLYKIPKFTYSNSDTLLTKKEEFEEFEKLIKNTIEDYENQTKVEIEKKYQYLFMKSKILADKCDKFKGLVPFEQEYYTDEKSKTKENRGRIDCVFVKIDENCEEENTELYLIELKVDETVIGSTNGVHKHLIDIEELMKNEEKLNNFITSLENRITYRRKCLQDKEIDIKIDRNKIHFWTVIAISSKSRANAVETMLFDNLTKEEYIKNKSNKLPKESKVLKEQIELLEKLIDVKFLFDKWDYKNHPNKLSDINLFEIENSFEDEAKKQLDKWILENEK